MLIRRDQHRGREGKRNKHAKLGNRKSGCSLMPYKGNRYALFTEYISVACCFYNGLQGYTQVYTTLKSQNFSQRWELFRDV